VLPPHTGHKEARFPVPCALSFKHKPSGWSGVVVVVFAQDTWGSFEKKKVRLAFADYACELQQVADLLSWPPCALLLTAGAHWMGRTA